MIIRQLPALINVQVCNEFLIAATHKNTLIRFPVNATEKLTEIKITPQSDDLVYNLFLDPMGWHTIICMQSGMSFYTNRSMKQTKAIQKAKDILIDSVAWNQFNINHSSTQEILIGSNDGFIYETVLLSGEGRIIATPVEQYWRQVATIGSSVTGVEVIRVPPVSISVAVGEPQRCVVLATTPSRIYQFAGWIHSSGGGITSSNSSSSTALVAHADAIATGANTSSPSSELSAVCPLPVGVVAEEGFSCSPAPPPLTGLQAAAFMLTSAPSFFHGVFTGDSRLPHGSKVSEFPKNFGYSDLKLYRPLPRELPKHFAWMTGHGIYFGNLKTEQLSLPPHAQASNYTTDTLCEDSASPLGETGIVAGHSRDVFAGRSVNFFRKTKILDYPVISTRERPGHPLGIAITAFHVVIAYADRVKVINILDDRTVFSMPISVDLGQSHALGICRDPVSGGIWLFGSGGIAQLKVNNESCRIWQIYTNRLQFDEARRSCQDDSQRETVNMREAEHCFDKGYFMRSARLFAKTSTSFEEVALRFSQLSLEHQQPLLTFGSSSPPIPKGLMVTSDDDAIGAVLSGLGDNGFGVESRQDAVLPELESEKGSTIDKAVAGGGAANEGRGSLQQMVNSAAPLKVLVETKLEILDRESKEKKVTSTSMGQAAFLSLWLAELLLTEIGFLRDQAAINRRSLLMDAPQLKAAEQEFKQLLMKPVVRSTLPHTKGLLYNLIESHGANKEFFLLTNLVGDYTRLCDKYMQLGRHADALELIDRRGVSNEGCIECMYKYAASLAATHPEDVVKTWFRLGKRLDPVKLLPAVMLLPPPQAMHYLNQAILKFGCSDQAAHHLLITLCAENSKATGPRSDDAKASVAAGSGNCPLMAYLEHVSAAAVDLAALEDHVQWEDGDVSAGLELPDQPGLNASLVLDQLPYDPGFVLRTCKEVGHLQGTVYVLKLLGMHQQALQTAVDADNIPLAKQIAGNSNLSSETRRHLWMRLAKHVIEKKNNIQEATTLLRECSLLKLEDILPYFHDFITVDQFKDSICSSLDSYCDSIDEVKRDMQATMTSASKLRNRLTELNYRYDELRADSRCLQCGHVLVHHSFYVFPCGHRFHVNCLADLARSLLTTEPTIGQSPDDPQVLIGSDCVVCGQLAIDGVANLYFPNRAAYEAELAIWK